MKTENKFKQECSEENARKFWEWIKNRAGVAIWKSINLSNPGAAWSTPATIAIKDVESETVQDSIKRLCPSCRQVIVNKTPAPCGDWYCVTCNKDFFDKDMLVEYGKPNWQCSNTPEVITDPKEIGVYKDELFKAFRVGLRNRGLSSSLTDGAQKKVDKYMDQCREKHGTAFYKKGVLDINGASIGIYYTTSIVPLDEWITVNGELSKDSH